MDSFRNSQSIVDSVRTRAVAFISRVTTYNNNGYISHWWPRYGTPHTSFRLFLLCSVYSLLHGVGSNKLDMVYLGVHFVPTVQM